MEPPQKKKKAAPGETKDQKSKEQNIRANLISYYYCFFWGGGFTNLRNILRRFCHFSSPKGSKFGVLRFRCSPDVSLQDVGSGGVSEPQRGHEGGRKIIDFPWCVAISVLPTSRMSAPAVSSRNVTHCRTLSPIVSYCFALCLAFECIITHCLILSPFVSRIVSHCLRLSPIVFSHCHS